MFLKLSGLALTAGVTGAVPALLMGVSFSHCGVTARTRTLLPAHAHHLAPEKRNLCRQRQVLRAHVMAGNERHAPKNTVVIADQFVVIVIVAPVARIETKARDLIETHRADEIFPHARGPTAGDTAAALDTPVELVNLF